jgi:hypothetical protein
VAQDWQSGVDVSLAEFLEASMCISPTNCAVAAV